MSRINVKIPAIEERSYPISIGTGTLCAVWAELEEKFAASGKFVVTDSNVVKAGHLETLLAGNDAPVFVIDPAGEISKTIDTVVSIVETMEKAKLGRDSVVIALGGGSVIDTTKAVSASMAVGTPGWLEAHFRKGKKFPRSFSPVPIIAVPTTAGTGSEVTM
ncbi:hypothetical protein LCGC14_3000280, partial [marine sediment metagenome]